MLVVLLLSTHKLLWDPDMRPERPILVVVYLFLIVLLTVLMVMPCWAAYQEFIVMMEQC